MTNLNDLNVVNAEASLKYGFFWVEFENGKSLQCCLEVIYDEDGQYVGYAEQIDANDTGFDEGVCWDCNEWAAGEDGEAEHINDFLIEQARKVGLQIVS